MIEWVNSHIQRIIRKLDTSLFMSKETRARLESELLSFLKMRDKYHETEKVVNPKQPKKSDR